jgi:hypothetical protein
MMYFNVRRKSLLPFPHLECVEVFNPETYAGLIAGWPPEGLFLTMKGPYKKLALSERCHPERYAAFLSLSKPWAELHRYVKSPAFIDAVFAVLGPFAPSFYASRFEFSSLPSDGGAIAPHRDIPSKILTIVVPMTLEAVPGWGTDILEPLGPVGKDYETPRDAFRTVSSFDYAPNTCGIFVKTADSWHAIGPLKGPAGCFRRTLTINIERA